jgi:hypothetical protein
MRSITMCRTTVLTAVAALPALAFAAPASAPEVTATEVGAWIVGDASFESPRFTKALRIDGLDATDVASRFASMPAGRRVAYSERILAGFVGDEGDRVVVSGRITDHVGPWIDAASKRTRLEVEQLAKELVSRGLSIDVLLLGGENPLSAEKLDTADDLVWMAIRNDRRFEEIASAEFSLAGTMSPSNPQWRAWNEFADVTIAKTIDVSVATPLREASAAASIAVPVTVGIGRSELDAMSIAIRMHGSFGKADSGGATTSFDVLADELELAVKASRGGRTLQPWVRPYSHTGTRGARSAVAGTLLWDELVRHATMLGNGRVVYEETRSRDLAAPDASRFAAVLDGVAEEFAGGASISSTDASIRRGQGFVAVGVPTASGETLWRISFSPGIGGVDVEIDGGGLRVERRRGESGAWLRTAADSRIEFFDRAFARNDATTGGGLLAAPTSKPQDKVGPLLSDGPEGGATLAGSGVGDLNGDGVVDGADLAIHLATGGDSSWGGVSDLNGDGVVDGADMAIQLSGGLDSNWNGTGWDDLNGDGLVDGADVAISIGGGGAGEPWNGAGWEDLNGDGVNDGADLAINLAGGGSPSSIAGDLNGDGVVDGADLAIELAGRIVVRKPDVAGRPKIIDGGVSTIDDPADDGAGPDGSDGGSNTTGGGPPQIDPTTPVTPPAGPVTPGASNPTSILVPVAMSDSLLEVEGPSRFIAESSAPTMLQLGAAPVRMIYQSVDPHASEEGTIDVSKVVEYVRQQWGENPSGWFMLDFEFPHMEHLLLGRTDPQHPDYVRTRDAFVNALQVLKATFPNTKWSVYSVPVLPHWFPEGDTGYTWWNVPESRVQSEISQRRMAYAPIVEECDWVSPSIYDRHDTRLYPAQLTRDRQVEVYRRRNAAMVELSKAMVADSVRPDRPVVPMVNLYYAPGGNTVETRKIPREQIVEKQLRPAIEAGADSIAFWTGAGHYAHIATSPPNPAFRLQNEVRDSVRLAYLDGEAPEAWVSAAVRAQLVEHFGNTIRQGVEDVISIRAGTLEPMNAAAGQ